MHDQVIATLIRRRRELTGSIFELIAQIDALTADVAALDRTLLLFAPDLKPDTIPALQSRPKADWAGKGEIARLVFAILRDAGEPMTIRALADELHQRRGLEGVPMGAHIKRLRNCLDRQKARGTLTPIRIDRKLHWAIV